MKASSEPKPRAPCLAASPCSTLVSAGKLPNATPLAKLCASLPLTTAAVRQRSGERCGVSGHAASDRFGAGDAGIQRGVAAMDLATVALADRPAAGLARHPERASF